MRGLLMTTALRLDELELELLAVVGDLMSIDLDSVVDLLLDIVPELRVVVVEVELLQTCGRPSCTRRNRTSRSCCTCCHRVRR